jgi:cystathionine gamma-lyase
MKFDTRCVRVGNRPDPTTGAILPPIYQTATYTLPEVGRDLGFDYTRSANPTRAMLEENLAALESGRFATCFASGMSAVDSIFRLFNPGDHIISSDDVYGGVSRLFNQVLVRYQLEFSYVDTSDPDNVVAAMRPNTRIIWVETPTNPLLKVTDLAAIGAIARERGVLFGADTTFATPALLRPFEYGADIVMHSTTKFLSGHNQVIGGVVIVNREDLDEHLTFIQKTVGAVPSPFDCWLTMLGVKTLPIRMHKHSENGMRVARFLEEHPKVARVSYPGLASHPQHAIAARQMDDFSGMITFELTGGIPAGRNLLNACRMISLAESLGAVETMITHPATMTHVDVPAEERHARGLTDGLVRLSVGIEHVDDILADLEQALAQA